MAGCDFNPPTFSLAHHVFVTPPPTSGDRHRMTLQRPLSAVYGTGRRGSINEVNNDSVLRQKLSSDVNKCGSGSEWVTLSKALLMQLVEQICQLSFQSDSNAQPSLSAKPETEVDFRNRRLLTAAVAMDCTTNDDVVKICAAAAAAKAAEDVNAASNDGNDDSSLDNRLIDNALEPDRAGVMISSAETKRAIDTKFDPVIDKNGPIGQNLRPCEEQPERLSESTHGRHLSSADGRFGAKEEEVERKQPTSPYRENLQSRQQAVQTHPSDECIEMEESLSKDAGSRCAARPAPLSSTVAAETMLPSSGSASATAVAAAAAAAVCIDGCCRQSADDFNMKSSKCSADDAELRQLMTSSRCLVGLNNNNVVSKVPPSDEADDQPLTVMSTGSGSDRPASVDIASYRKHRSVVACAPNVRRSSTDMGLHYRQHDRRYIRARRRHRIAYSTGGIGGDFICPNFAEEAARMDYAVAAGGHVTQRRPIRRVVSQQPWIAMNKTIVYQMLDAALGQQLARGEASATMTSAERRRNNARNAIWNPAISSRSSTPDNETQQKSSSNRNTPATVTLSAVSTPVYGAMNDRIRDIGQLMELHPGLSASLMTRDQQVTCSILRELFATERHTSSVTSHPVVARRHSEATPSGPASATTPTFAVPDLPPDISPQLRRRHHSASNEALAPASVNSRYNQSAQGFSSLLFVDTTHGRDIYNYFRYPEVLPVSATASSALDYTLQTLDKQTTVAEKGFSSSISPPSLFERKRKSQPEAVPALPGVTPRWVAFNKGDVSSLFETVATAMMAAETAPGASPTSATMTSSSSSHDLHSPPEVASRRPAAAASTRTRSVGGSAESVFRRPLPESPSEPIKWKSSLMRRMKAEATPCEAIETDENKTVT